MYNEDQMLPLPLLILVVLVATCVFIAPLVFAWHAGRLYPGMFWVVIAPIAITFLVMSLRLKIKLDEAEVSARIWPFPTAQFKYSDIRKVEELEYSPMADFGGWGIRYGLGGKIYSMRGSHAVKLSLSSGKIVYLGTQESGKLAAEIRAHLVAQ